MASYASRDSEQLAGLIAETSGSAGLTTFPAGAAAANGVSQAEVLRYAQENIILGAGTALPSGTSLYGVLAGATGIPTFPAAAAAGNNVSLAEVLRYISETQIGLLASMPRYVEKQHTSPLTTGNVFTFAGTIEIMAIWGRITTVIENVTTNVKLSVTNDALAAYDICANVDIDNDAVGSLLSITGTAANAMVSTANGVLAPTQASRIIATCTTSGAISATYGNASTGAILWQMLWRPLSSGASVAAA